MKVQLIGKEVVSPYHNKAGKIVSGITLHYLYTSESVNGQAAANVWIKGGTSLYDRIKNVDLTKPVQANLVNELLPGSKYPTVTELNIIS